MELGLRLPLGEGNVGSPESSAPNAFISIDGDGKVLLTMPDLGIEQGICTSIPILIVEELEIALNQVRLEHTPSKERFNGNTALNARATGNSNAVRDTLKLLGEAGATARAMLIASAAKRWGVDARSCHTHEGEVIHTPTWRKFKYGELAVEAAFMPIPKEVVPIP